MFRTTLFTLIVLVIAIVGGSASAWYALQAREGTGAVHVGPWTAYPDSGTPEADPYTKARLAREGTLALGKAEGLPFAADTDSSGMPLLRECRYVIAGAFPAARFWTLYSIDQSFAAITSERYRSTALHSYEILQEGEETVTISVQGQPAPGNWLMVPGSGPFHLVLTFYDTPIANSTGLAGIHLPEITKSGCDA